MSVDETGQNQVVGTIDHLVGRWRLSISYLDDPAISNRHPTGIEDGTIGVEGEHGPVVEEQLDGTVGHGRITAKTTMTMSEAQINRTGG